MYDLYLFTGGKGAGKSTAGVTCCPPSAMKAGKMLAVDTENSLNDITEELGSKGYTLPVLRAFDRFPSSVDVLGTLAKGKVPWQNDKEMTSLGEYWEWLVKELDGKLKTGMFEYLLIDSVEPIEASVSAWVEGKRRRGEIKDTGWSGKTAYGGSEIEAVRPILEGFCEGIAARGVKTILFTSHLKNPWVEYAPGKAAPAMDKVKPGGRLSLWSRLSKVIVWLVRPARPMNAVGAPSGIILKGREGQLSPGSDDTWETKSLLPPRMPMFTWAEWRKYLKDGWNPLQPKEGELLYDDEKELVSELMSNTQMALMAAMVEYETEALKASTTPRVVAGDPVAFVSEEAPEDKAKRLHGEGRDLAEIAAEVGRPWLMVKKWVE